MADLFSKCITAAQLPSLAQLMADRHYWKTTDAATVSIPYPILSNSSFQFLKLRDTSYAIVTLETYQL